MLPSERRELRANQTGMNATLRMLIAIQVSAKRRERRGEYDFWSMRPLKKIMKQPKLKNQLPPIDTFCGKEPAFLTKPYQYEGYRYATDGRIAVRYRQTGGDSDSIYGSQIASMFERPSDILITLDAAIPVERFVCPGGLIPGYTTRKCSKRITGRHRTKYDGIFKEAAACESCGRQTVKTIVGYVINERPIDAYYFDLMRKLPQVQFYKDSLDGSRPIQFTFIGGNGVVMPTQFP